MFLPSRNLERAGFAGPRQRHAGHNPFEIARRQSCPIHALDRGLEDRGKALLHSKANIGGACDPFTYRRARDIAKAGAPAAAAAVDSEQKEVRQGVHFQCSVNPLMCENQSGSKSVLLHINILRNPWIPSARVHDILISMYGRLWTSSRR